MDVAASEFYRNGKYDLDFKSPDDPKRHITGDQLGDLYKSFIKNYPGQCNQMMSLVFTEEKAFINNRVEFLLFSL